MASSRFLRFRCRRGSATLWLIIWLPCLMALFCALFGVANLWLARIELENAVEASALAAVKSWGNAGGGSTLTPRNVGVAYAHANFVRSQSVPIDANYESSANPNQNATCNLSVSPAAGNLIFGALDVTDPDNVIFDAGKAPDCNSCRQFAVRAQAYVDLQPLGFQPFLGNLTSYRVQAKATAAYDCATQRVRLVRIDTFICP